MKIVEIIHEAEIIQFPARNRSMAITKARSQTSPKTDYQYEDVSWENTLQVGDWVNYIGNHSKVVAIKRRDPENKYLTTDVKVRFKVNYSHTKVYELPYLMYVFFLVSQQHN